jgi:hypothetical protein
MLLLPALNAMFDITTTRTEAARVHPPLMIFGMLGALTLACSLFAGYDMAIRRRLNVLHSVAFAVVLSVYGHPGPRYPDRSRITNQRSLITNQYPRVIIFAADKYGHICSGAKSIGNVPALGGK